MNCQNTNRQSGGWIEMDKICPLLTRAGSIETGKIIFCIEEKCALWDKKHRICGLKRRDKNGF